VSGERATTVAWTLVTTGLTGPFGPFGPVGAHGDRMPMAVDEALLEAAISGEHGEAAVRFYRWANPTLSVGAKQDVPPAVMDRCAAAGVEVVRRPTGGAAVLHRGDVTYAVAAPDGGMGVLGIYRWVAEGLVAGFAALGLGASVVERRPPGTTAQARALACFAVPTGADLEVAGRKVCGSAQVRRSGWFLQHGSIPVEDVRVQTAKLLGLGEPKGAAGSTCIELERPGTAWDEIAQALEQGFMAAWGEPSAVRPLDAAEQAIASRLAERSGLGTQLRRARADVSSR
jgi:lipoate-protein ligase A